MAGFPFAWKKSDGGQAVDWIGASLRAAGDEIVASAPARKAVELLEETRELVCLSVVPVRRLRSYAGRLSFIAGLVPTLRPFLGTIWAAIADLGD